LGREAAIQFAARGANVVLGARRVDALEETARLCRERGAEAHVVPTDVTSEDEVRALADAAITRFGRLDVWVNNAGVTLFSLLEEAPFSEHRRVIETNLFGAILGARAAMPIFRHQGHGVLINVGSVLSKVGQPFVPSYVISKFGVHGLSEVLRTEYADDPDIHICTLYPYVVDTQHFEAGANEIGLQARGLQPIQEPEPVAKAIVDLAEHPKRERHVPRIAVLGLVLHRLLPNTVERLLLHTLRRWHFGPDPQPRTSGNLYTPDSGEAAVHGERRPRVSTPGFALWVVRETMKIEGEAATRWVGSLRQRMVEFAAR
jgi:NAD(P)-dependent dehydrogenase (short-subunit alcohol dehydrogenase family)